MSRGRLEREWIPFVEAPKHRINNEHLVCMTQRGGLYACMFENEQFKTLDGALIENVVVYQNNKSVSDAIKLIESTKI